MTEAEWLACTDPKPMLELLRDREYKRKVKLFCVACCWRLQQFLSEYSQQMLSAIEGSADIDSSLADASALSNDAMAYADGLSYRVGSPEGCAHWLAASAVWQASESNAFQTSLDAALAIECSLEDPGTFNVSIPAPASSGNVAELVAQAVLLRCIFGPMLFRRVSLDSSWLTPSSKQFAQAIYDDRAFDRLPILADALEEAGCTNADLLAHCREPGEHVLGCWVVDLLLGKM